MASLDDGQTDTGHHGGVSDHNDHGRNGVSGTCDEESDDDVDEFVNEFSTNPIGHKNEEKARKIFMTVCRRGLDVNRLVFLLKHGVEMDGTDGRGRTGLMWACRFGHGHLVDWLLREGASPDVCDEGGMTPLMLASRQGHEHIVELLLKSVKDIDGQAVSGRSALVFACEEGHEGVAKALIDHGADFMSKQLGPCHRSAMRQAIDGGRVNIVRLLFQRGFRLNFLSRDNQAILLDTAAYNGQKQIVELLIQNGADIHAKFFGKTAITACWYSGDTEVLEVMLNHGANVNDGEGGDETLLMGACRFEYEHVVEMLLKYGANVNATSDEGDTALMSLINCESEIPKIEIAQILLKNGADVNIKCNAGQTALMCASSRDLHEFVKLFLDAGVVLEDTDQNGQTAVMYAAKDGAPNCLKLLIDAGVNVDLTDNDGLSILSCAMQFDEEAVEECLKVLLDKGVLTNSDETLKSIHSHANHSHSSYEAVEASMVLGFFEWGFCSYPYSEKCLVALKHGYTPGKMRPPSSKLDDTSASPLIVAFLEDDTEAIEIFLKYRYYFPEDYRLLGADEATRELIPSSSLFDNFTLKPLSLFTWSFITISKAISLSTGNVSRSQKIQTLALPDMIKRLLSFEMSDEDQMRLAANGEDCGIDSQT